MTSAFYPFAAKLFPRRDRRAARRRPATVIRIEHLEARAMLAFDPSAQAQEMLENVNRMRLNPQAELNVLFTSMNPLTARDAGANAAIKYANDPTSTAILAEWSSLRPVAPLAWNESLVAAATGHSQLMVRLDQQSHQLPGEASLADRIINAGYVGISGGGENVNAYASTVFNAHSAFAIDSNVAGRGHRANLMNPAFRDFGVGLVADNSSLTRVGPLVTTQNFGSRFNYGNPFLLGVVYRDGNANGRYDAGEGLGGVNVRVTGAAGTFTTTTMSAGGYQLKVPGGAYTVTASGGGLAAPEVRTVVVVASANAKVDFTGVSTAPGPTAPPVPTGVVATAGNGRVTVRWNAPATNGGNMITGYAVQYSSNDGRSWTTATVPATTRTSASVTGLTNGVAYVFRVAAVNAAGTGNYSTTSARVTPTTGSLTTIDLAPHANRRLQAVGFGAVNQLPEGDVTLGGIGFAIPVGGNNVWTGAAATGSNPRILDVAVNATGVTKVYTLINTLWGERATGARASITFYGSTGTVYAVELDGNNHIRDYLWNTWTNTINGTSTVNVFTAGSGQGVGSTNQVRLDMQTFQLPAAFAKETLTKIRITDWGGTNDQRLIVSGITVR